MIEAIRRKVTYLVVFSIMIGLLTGFSNSPLNDLPEIIDVKTKPYPIIGNWVTLPQGPGKLKINVLAKNATKVQFWLVPTGTATWKYRELIGEDTDGKDGWSMTWRYGNELIHTHIVIIAVNPKGTSGHGGFNVTTKTEKRPSSTVFFLL